MSNAPSTKIAPGHQLRAAQIGGHTYTATAEMRGQREQITVYRDGEKIGGRVTTNPGRYSFAILCETSKGVVAYSYSAKPKAAGSKVDYVRVVASLPIQREEAAPAAPAATTPGTTVPVAVPVAAPLAEGELAEMIRTKLAAEEASVAQLAAAAQATRRAQLDLEGAVCAAARRGMSHRAIAKAAGVTHPTVASILRRYGVA